MINQFLENEFEKNWLFGLHPPIINKEQKDRIYQMTKKPHFDAEQRRMVWLLASGAKNAMESAHES